MKKRQSSKALLSPADMRKVAASAGCEARTIGRYFAGANTQPTLRDAIERALRKGGVGHLVRAQGVAS